jgi:hypothetical protein
MSDLLDDQNLDVTTDGNRDHRTSDLLVYRNLDASHVNRNCVRHDQKTDENLDGNRANRNCARHDLMTVGNLDVNLCLRMNDLLGGHLMDVNHVNRSCVRRDLMMV